MPWIQNNCSSSGAFNPEFKIGFNSLIFSASLNKIIFQFLCLSIISTPPWTKLMCADVKSNLSLFWIDNDKKQRDNVCMRSSLGALSTNIMTDLDEKLSKPLINDNTIKLYLRYVGHTLFVIKRYLLNNSYPNLCFTVDLIKNEVPHFLDLQLFADGISIFKNNTTPILTSRTSLICFSNKLSSEINFIKKLASWNGVPRPVIKCIIHQVLNTRNKSTDNANHLRYWTSTFVCLTIAIAEKFNLIALKLVPLDSGPSMMLIIEFCCNTWDKTAVVCNLFVIFDFSIPDCRASYNGKTENVLRKVSWTWIESL